MGGICGVWGGQGRGAVDAMMDVVRHRGPDETGVHSELGITLGHARLSVTDLNGSSQPFHNENQSIWLTCNGEIFNDDELRRELTARGHRFATDSDCETLVHLYEEYGMEALQRVNGQFAFALWDRRRQSIFLARDRMGAMPLYYTTVNRRLYFGSEIKSLIAGTGISAEIDPRGLAQVFTFRATVPPRTVFRNINELPAGSYLSGGDGAITVRQYWDIDFGAQEKMPEDARQHRVLEEGMRDLLDDAVRLRLRADVPVGVYFDGGLDSSVIAALSAQHRRTRPVMTFSTGFAGSPEIVDAQRRAASLIGAIHHDAVCERDMLDAVLAGTVWHAEQPLFRLATAPRYLLARLAQRQGVKVVISSEGGPELFGGYGLAAHLGEHRAREAGELFPQARLWAFRSRAKHFFSAALHGMLGDYNPVDDLAAILPPGFRLWSALSRLQYLDIKILLPGYQLSSQSDRMNMAHGLTARYPFLDFRLVERCARLPDGLKIRDSNDRHLLRRVARQLLPGIVTDHRHGYRAPAILPAFDDMLSEESLRRCGCFDIAKTRELADICGRKGLGNPHDHAILTGIATTVLLHRMFTAGNTIQ